MTVHLVQSSASKGSGADSGSTAAKTEGAPATAPSTANGGLGTLPGMPTSIPLGPDGRPDLGAMSAMLGNPQV